ncbi:MAG: hypothetical protein V1752_06430 [Candidatus Firestonebacteria bacterium]
MKKTKKKVRFWKNPFVQLLILAGVILCCVIGYYIYSLPAFWVRPATAEFSPEEGKGLYLGMSAAELKAVKSKLSLYKNGKLFIHEIYYDRKIGGRHFDSGHYTFNTCGRLINLGFSKHLKQDIMEKEKYEYIKYFVSKYGVDYKKGIWVFKPYSNKRFVYDMFVWEKKDARIVLEFSFYDNDKDGYLCRNCGIYLDINYPKAKNEGLYNKFIDDQKNSELKETFRHHFPDLDREIEDLKKAAKLAVPPEKNK